MCEAGDNTAEHVKYKIPHLAHPVFHIIAKNEKDPHIRDQVKPSPVQEHVGKERPENGNSEFVKAVNFCEPYLIGNQSVVEYHHLGLLAVEHKHLEYKNGHIGYDQQPGHNGKAPGGYGIT